MNIFKFLKDNYNTPLYFVFRILNIPQEDNKHKLLATITSTALYTTLTFFSYNFAIKLTDQRIDYLNDKIENCNKAFKYGKKSVFQDFAPNEIIIKKEKISGLDFKPNRMEKMQAESSKLIISPTYVNYTSKNHIGVVKTKNYNYSSSPIEGDYPKGMIGYSEKEGLILTILPNNKTPEEYAKELGIKEYIVGLHVNRKSHYNSTFPVLFKDKNGNVVYSIIEGFDTDISSNFEKKLGPFSNADKNSILLFADGSGFANYLFLDDFNAVKSYNPSMYTNKVGGIIIKLQVDQNRKSIVEVTDECKQASQKKDFLVDVSTFLELLKKGQYPEAFNKLKNKILREVNDLLQSAIPSSEIKNAQIKGNEQHRS